MAGAGEVSVAASVTSISQPRGEAVTSAPTGARPCRKPLEASSAQAARRSSTARLQIRKQHGPINSLAVPATCPYDGHEGVNGGN